MKTPLLVFVSLALAGCAPDEATKSRTAALELRVSTLESRVAAEELTTQKIAGALSKSVVDLQYSMLSKIESEEAAVVDPSSKGFIIARNEYGAFPIIVEDAQPYLDGHKIRFRIGNLTSASITDVSLLITYGVRDPDFPSQASLTDEERSKALQSYTTKLEDNKKLRKTITVDAGEELAPASWNYVEAIISPSKPEELGRIEIRVRAKGVKLMTKK